MKSVFECESERMILRFEVARKKTMLCVCVYCWQNVEGKGSGYDLWEVISVYM
jgi:hypothetical protein